MPSFEYRMTDCLHPHHISLLKLANDSCCFNFLRSLFEGSVAWHNIILFDCDTNRSWSLCFMSLGSITTACPLSIDAGNDGSDVLDGNLGDDDGDTWSHNNDDEPYLDGTWHRCHWRWLLVNHIFIWISKKEHFQNTGGFFVQTKMITWVVHSCAQISCIKCDADIYWLMSDGSILNNLWRKITVLILQVQNHLMSCATAI